MASKGQGKIMSSRLANMGFMQRAAASSPSTPGTPTEPPAKKQRLSNGSSIRSPATPAESQKRVEAVEQEAASKGETKWYLSFKAPQVQQTESPLRIVSAGYSALDAGHEDEPRPAEDDDEPKRPLVSGRKSFGNFNRAGKKFDEDKSEEEDDSEEDEDGEISDDPTGVKALIAQGRKDATDRAKAERRAKKAAENAESQRLAEQRRKKEVNLNKVTSISSGGGRPSGGGGKKDTSSSYFETMVCHRCKETGHMMKNCPQRGQRR